MGDLQRKDAQVVPGKPRQGEREYKASLGYTWETLPGKSKATLIPKPRATASEPNKQNKTHVGKFNDFLLILLTSGETFCYSIPRWAILAAWVARGGGQALVVAVQVSLGHLTTNLRRENLG